MRRLWVLLLCAAPGWADVTLAGVFGNNMVLQRGKKVSIWGRARPRERVTVKYAKRTATAKADNDGNWRVEMGPFEINEGAKLTVSGRNRITLTNVCVGEVWICSGQSNMEFAVARAMDAAAELKRANDSQLRLFVVPHRVSGSPQTQLKGASWKGASPDTVKAFSAVAYFFGRRLRRDFDLPIGLIQTCWGGTPAEAWTRHAVLATEPALKPIVARWDAALAAYPAKLRQFQNALSDWRNKRKQALKAGKPPPRRPIPPLGPNHPHRPAGLWNAMIRPLVPFAMRGVIWYQGESNALRADQYRTLFPAMIRDWRRAWKGEEFPFLFVQLANFRPLLKRVAPSPWAELRDAQRFALSLPNTGMAVTIDIGNAFDIHPRNKQEVGRRLALIAEAKVYGEMGTVFSGPVFRELSLDGRHFILRFEQIHGGLKTVDDDPLRGFMIAGPDKRFRWAYARIQADTVVVWHPRIEKPAAVRYGWADNPDCNLVNGEGLPAGPFRTDDWPTSTAKNR